MTPRDIDIILHKLEELRADVQEVRDLARETNGRVRKLEIWRAGLDAVEKAHAWIRPALVAFVTGAALSAIGWALSSL
jgi:hypothetical protein